MPGYDRNAPAEVPVGHRYACICRSCESACYSRNYLEVYAVLYQELELFSTAAEKERIPALEPHDFFPFECFLKQKSVYLLLLHCVISGPLSNVYQLSIFRQERHHSASHERVINYHICVRKHLSAFQSNEGHFSRPCSDKPHFAFICVNAYIVIAHY